MSKTFILHDLRENKLKNLTNNFSNDSFHFSANSQIKRCVGCFGCWVKTPGECVLKDHGTILPQFWASSNHVIIVSELVYGGFSKSIKACMDRSLGYILPYFRIINGKMHHKLRYKNNFNLSVYFYSYSKEITVNEKEIASQLVNANAVNFGAKKNHTYFYNSIEEIVGDII